MPEAVIDRKARDNLAQAIRALASGLISNDEFEDKRLPFSDDTAIYQVYANGAWSLHSDLQSYRLIGRHRLGRSDKSTVARWVLFLKTDLAYEWPVQSVWRSFAVFIGSLLTLGLVGKWNSRRYASFGDAEVWPFIRREDYEKALQKPPYLNGQMAAANCQVPA